MSTDSLDLRVVVPLPPQQTFDGRDRAYAEIGIGDLEKLGIAVQTVEPEDCVIPDRRRETVARLTAFAPHFVLGIPNAGYPLLFETEGVDGAKLFTDLLSVPVVLPWDHLLTQSLGYFVNYAGVEVASRGALKFMQRALGNPLLRHYSSDSGHIGVYEELGILAPGRALRYLPGAYTPFLAQGFRRTEAANRGRIGFAGNLYSSCGSKLQILHHPLLRRIDEVVRAGKRANWDVSAWHLLCHALEQIPGNIRDAEGLTPDHVHFWKVALDLLSYRLTTEFRLAVLEAIPYPIDFYGNFADPESTSGLEASGHIRFCDSADFRTELPRVFSAYELWVDATNAPFVHGCGSKAFDCFAAGSLMLIDYRADVHAEFGELALRFMYRSRDELVEHIEFYLKRPDERAAVIAAVQAIIRQRLTREYFYKRVCADLTADLAVRAGAIPG